MITANSSTRSADRWILTATILASSMAFLDSAALNVAIPAIQSDLNASGQEVLWIVNGYLLMLAAFIMVGGSLGDRYGRNRVYGAGIIIFMAGSVACGLSPNMTFLILARILQGLGGALMIPGSLAIINATITPSRRGEAIGTWSAVTTVIFILGPLLGGILAGAGLWRAVFLINIPLAIPALWILLTKVPETRNEKAGPIDTPGAALAALALAALTYGFIAAPEAGFNDPLVLLTLIGGGLAAGAFIWVEAHTQNPMMPLHLFRNPCFSGANLLTFFLYGALSAASLFLSLNLVQAQGYTPSQAGLATTPFAVLLALLSRWAGKMSDRFGPRRFLIIGPAIVGAGFFWMALVGLTSGPASYWWTFFPGVVLFGAGMGFTVAPLTTTVMSSAPQDYSGTASGINNAVSRIAGLLAIAVLGALALVLFEDRLINSVANMQLNSQVVQQLRIGAAQLGGLTVPAEVSPAQQEQVEQTINLAFSQTFRVVLVITAVMAWLSAAMAYWLIRDD